MIPKSPISCVSVAEGHGKPVLSVHATNELLFSGSKDRSVKIWDLNSQKEIQSLSEHPNLVNAVKYSEQMKLVFSVSSSYVKVWDLRIKPNVCIKTLSSSGLTTNGPISVIFNYI